MVDWSSCVVCATQRDKSFPLGRPVFFQTLSSQVTAVAQQNQGEVPEPQDMKVAEVLFDAADANAIEEVNLAYENVKEVDGLDVSKEGTEAWEAAMKRYDERIDRVETRITARLRDQLGTAKNANESIHNEVHNVEITFDYEAVDDIVNELLDSCFVCTKIISY